MADPDITITDVFEAVKIVNDHPDTYRVVSISTPATSVFARVDVYSRDGLANAKEVLFLEFDDASDRLLEKAAPEIRQRFTLVSEDDCRQALEFLQRGGKCLVHCQAGISRSTATALGYLLTCYDDYRIAVDKLLEIRPWAEPNDRVLRLMCRILEREQDYSIIVEYFQQKKYGKFRQACEAPRIKPRFPNEPTEQESGESQ